MIFNKPYNIVFISTFIDVNNINNLIDSVSYNNKTLSILFIVINQTKSELIKTSTSLVNFHVINTEHLPLSNARNIGIKYLMEKDIKFEHIMFPDDDTTFSDVFFNRFTDIVKSTDNYLIDVYCYNSTKLYKAINYREGDCLNSHNFEAAMSVNMIINYNTFNLVGLFDQRLGVGAKYGAGEDCDFFIRACNLTKQGFIYTKILFNFHPSSYNKFSKMKLKQIISKYVNYGNGAIFMLCKHKMYIESVKLCFRSIGGIFFSLLKFNIKCSIGYIVAFFSRSLMLIKCITYHKQLYNNNV